LYFVVFILKCSIQFIQMCVLASFTLIPAGVIVGIGEATMWPVMLLYCVHYARCYARYASKSTQAYVTEFIGTFYLLFQFSAVSF